MTIDVLRGKFPHIAPLQLPPGGRDVTDDWSICRKGAANLSVPKFGLDISLTHFNAVDTISNWTPYFANRLFNLLYPLLCI